MQKNRLLLLTVAHFLVDTYGGILAPIMPLVILKLGLNYAAAGVLGTVTALISLGQPLLGLWADRMRRRYLVIGGVLLASVFTPLLGIAGSYWAMMAVLALGGLGVSAFHPQAFSLAGELSAGRRSFGLALFIFGGTLALGTTPLLITGLAGHWGLEALPVVMVPGLAVALVCSRVLPMQRDHLPQQDLAAALGALRRRWAPLTVITAVVMLRCVTHIGFATFLTVLGQEHGLSPAQSAIPLTIYQTCGVVGSLLAGYLADRVDPKPLCWGSILLACPALSAYLLVDGWAALALLALGGAMIGASNSVMVAMAQEMAPDHASLASSLPLGFSWGAAGLMLPLIGHAADIAGLETTLRYLALLPILTAALALLLPRRERFRVAA